MSQPSLSYLFQEDLYQIPPKVTVVLKKNWEKYSSEEKALLLKILGSVKLSTAAVQILTQGDFSFSSMTHDTTSKVLIFGSTTEGLASYQAIQAQGFSVVKADDLSELDDQKKKSLWVALKSMFGI